MSSHGNNGHNVDLMLSVRRDLEKNEITGHALFELQKLIDSLDYIFHEKENIKKESKYISVKELITVYKWSYQLCSMATFLPIFSDIINNGLVRVEDVPKFDSLMYKVMGE